MYLQIAFGHMSSQIMTMSNPVMQLEVYKLGLQWQLNRLQRWISGGLICGWQVSNLSGEISAYLLMCRDSTLNKQKPLRSTRALWGWKKFLRHPGPTMITGRAWDNFGVWAYLSFQQKQLWNSMQPGDCFF